MAVEYGGVSYGDVDEVRASVVCTGAPKMMPVVIGEVACNAGTTGVRWGKNDAIATIHIGAGAGAGAGDVRVVKLWRAYGRKSILLILGLDMLMVGFKSAMEMAEACEVTECLKVTVILVVDGGAVAFVGAHYGGAEGEFCPSKKGVFVPSLPP